MDEKVLDQWLEEAHAALDDDREVAAVEILSRCVAHRPKDGHSWLFLGTGLRILGRKEEAQRALLRAEELAPEKKRYLVQNQLGMLHVDWGKYDEAEFWFAKATANPHAPRPYRAGARASCQLGKWA